MKFLTYLKPNKREIIFLLGGAVIFYLMTTFWNNRKEASIRCLYENMKGQPESMQEGTVSYCLEKYGPMRVNKK